MSKMIATVAAVAMLALAAMPSAEASHFRYGTLSWKSTPDQPDPTKLRVELITEMALRRGWLVDRNYTVVVGEKFDLQGSTMEFGDGDSVTEFKDFTVTVSREADDLIMGQFRTIHDYDRYIGTNEAAYTVSYEDCCRLAACVEDTSTASGVEEGSPFCIHNNGAGGWRLETVVNTHSKGLQSAASSFIPVVEIGNTGTQLIQMAALPPDDDDLIWKLAGTSRAMLTHPSNVDTEVNGEIVSAPDPAIFSIDETTGILSFTVDGFPEGLYTTQVTVSGTKNPEVEVPVDFFIKITADSFLCVDQCDVSGITCAHEDSTLPANEQAQCAGPCIGQSYASCQRNEPPQVDVPDQITRTINNEVSFTVKFDESNIYERYQALEMTTGSLPPGSIFEWFPSAVASQYDYGVLTLPAAMTAEPAKYTACFVAHDGYISGSIRCTKISILEQAVDCFNLYDTIEGCSTEPECFWDKDGDNDPHATRTRQGCYPFSECSQMDDTGLACTSHRDCHYTGFGTCIESPNSVKPITLENPFGDPCRDFDKKTCREVDGRHLPKRTETGSRAHCVWDTLNRWCVTPELHVSHADICRPINHVDECNNAVRNGDRCVWIEDPYFRDMRSPHRDEHYGSIDNSICPHNKCPQNAPGICMSTETQHGLVDGTDVGPATANLQPLGTGHKATYLNTLGRAAYTGESPRTTPDHWKYNNKGKQSAWRWVIPNKSFGLTESWDDVNDDDK